MKTKITTLLCAALALPFVGKAQQLPDTTGLTMDALQVPNSPAFALMDLAPSTIDEPKVPSDFVVFLRNATDSFTTWPKNYGIEFAPAWAFGKRNIDFSDFRSNKLCDNMWQSLTLSAGINHLDDPNLPAGNGRTTQLGFGLKMSLLRGDIESSHHSVDSLYLRLGKLNKSLYKETENQLNSNAGYNFWNARKDSLRKQTPIDETQLQIAVDSLNAITAIMNESSENLSLLQDSMSESARNYAAMKPLIDGLKMNRRGFKLDLAGGFATDFYDQRVDSSYITRVGAWLTGGYAFGPSDDKKTNVTALGVLRLLGNPNQLYRLAENSDSISQGNNLFFDYGGRLILHNGKRFSFSAELLGRMPVKNDALKSTYRYSVNMDYQVTSSIVLSFHIGKNFDGTMSKSGNLITALQMFTSLGKRSYSNGKML